MAEVYYVGDNGKKKLTIKPKASEPLPKEDIKTGYMMGPVPFMPVMAGAAGAAPQQAPVIEEDQSAELFKEIELLRSNAVTLGNVVPNPNMEVEQSERMPEAPEEDLKLIKIRYPLIPRDPKQGERVFAYADIFFDNTINELVYRVVEPKLSENEVIVLNEIKEYIQDKLDINFAQIRKSETSQYITDVFNKAVQYLRVRSDVEVLKYYVLRDFIGLELIEPFLQDRNIEDISCDGLNIPIYVYHRDTRLGSLRTNVMFSNNEDLDSFVNKLSERSGKTITIAKPLLDGTLPDGSRVQATLGSDIARHGSNFTIRMFTENPLTPVDLINFGTSDLRIMAYLWFLVEHESSILVSGGTASGKTSLLNVLSLFIKPQMKIVSIEDTAELRLPHSHWVPEVARASISEIGEGQVDMFELLRESLRQRPDYIIVGEVRGREAYVLFQQMAVGHSGLATIHAENFVKLLDRLTTAPISLPANLIQNLDSIIFVKRIKHGRRYMRRISSAVEVLGYDRGKDRPIVGEVFKWSPAKDAFTTAGKSAVLRKIANSTGMSETDVQKELENRAKVLSWMVKKDMKDYRTISSIINLYYLSPEYLLSRVEAEL